MEIDKNKVKVVREYFKNKPVLKAYLFGSYVRNEADEQSDIDLLLDLDYSQKIGLEFVQMKIDLEKILEKKVDLVSSNALSKDIKMFVNKEKQLIYAR